MSEHLTFSFSHLFELARELSISLDQSGRHSQNDRPAIKTLSDDTALERTSIDRDPHAINLFTQRARQRHARFQRALPHRQAATPPADAIGPAWAVNGGFDQRPAQPGRA